jgi:hypothetical protein
MKKILLAAAFLAVASTNAFSAACVNGTLASLNGVTCTVTNGAGSWDLSLFGFGGVSGSATQVGYNADVTTGDVFVSFGTATNGGGGLGFYVDFSDAAGGNNYFSATSGLPNQSVDWRTIFKVVANNVDSNISQVDHNVIGSVTNAGNNGQVYVQKILRDVGNGDPIITDASIQNAAGSGANPSALITVADNLSKSQIAVIDNYQIASGNNGTSTLTSYRNYFYAADPQTGVPEPMTFVLMGAGLVGVAALRRRKA